VRPTRRAGDGSLPPPTEITASVARERRWWIIDSVDGLLLAASAAVAVVAVVTRVHDVGAFPAMHDWDGAGHAVNVIALREGHWPDLHTWSGSHPPLYYLIGALLWVVLPDALPVHVTMRLVSAAAWFGTVALVWRALRRLGAPVDAAVVAVVLLGVPGLTIASSMMTNDALCALFVTATIVRLLETPRDRLPTPRVVAVTAALAGLAAATKATGLAAIGFAGAFYAWRGRRDVPRALRMLAVFSMVSGVIAAPHYLRLFLELSGSPYDVVTVSAGSPEKKAIEWFAYALARAHMRFSSLWTLAYAALWDDPTSVYLPRDVETYALARIVWTGGLLVSGVALAGVVRVLARRDLASRVAVALGFGVLYAAAVVPHAILGPYIVLTKTNYILPEALPLGIVLSFGLGWARAGFRTVLRILLLTVAAAGIALTVYGWWNPAIPTRSRSREPSTNPAARVVERYFEYRASDPIRALYLLAPEVQLAHGLTLLHVLGLPPLPAEPGLAPADERARDVARGRVAWLELYNLVPWIPAISSGFDLQIGEVTEHDGVTDVRVRVAANGTTAPHGGEIGLWPFRPFEERFTVVRRDGAPRIMRIEQSGVVAENAVEVFAAHPSLESFELLRSIGWRSPGAEAAAALGQSR